MGQPLPLPERIPVPIGKTRQKMLDAGIILNDDDKVDGYITYELPEGWKLVNDSHRSDLPNFNMVDPQGQTRFTVAGAWKGTYDNELNIYAA